MGAGPWTAYNSAKRYLMNGGIDLDDDSFMMALFQNGSNALDLTMTTFEELTGEVAGANGYTQGGMALQHVIWDVGDTPSELRFSADALLWTASGGAISNVQYAVIWKNSGTPSTDYLLFVAALDENAPFDVPDGDPLSVQFGGGGIFELN